MKQRLSTLITSLVQTDHSLPDTYVSGIALHSNDVKEGYLYIAIQGTKFDGHDFIPDAVSKGASAVITNGRDLGDLPIPQIKIANPRRAASILAAEFYGHPSKKLTVVGITGTNGKTTTVSLLTSILKSHGFKTAQMGTLGLIADGYPQQKTLTTSDPVSLHKTFSDLLQNDFTHVVMEVSSHALHQLRVADVDFNLAVFTNLTPEHLDYHGSMEEYYHTKSKLFQTLPITATAVVNKDDAYGEKICSDCSAPILTTSVSSKNDIHFQHVQTSATGISGDIQAGEHIYQIESSLIGRFNLENILSAVASAHAMGIPASAIEAGIRDCHVIPGRMETFTTTTKGTVIVDYAHTPDSYEQVLSTIRGLSQGWMSVLFGVGGDRDASKRPIMATIAEKHADFCYIAPDNPRWEDPSVLNNEVVSGFTGESYQVFLDRGEALKTALATLKNGDVLIVLGKGREEYQDVRGEKIQYSDIKIIQSYCV
ncbi:MAG: UDP-N-acetylmuramoyl-L-alanyl-D-glutamate--2,6-diaminopimelate ligase [Candidatus Marinimicrobia bacterium]|nr:UDP-N-acetylmuramoyl-L-alanyl-D-glutamate--2,6-diaminopimelate ligase [Candidatus Neomarinimicrobiota bacterium]